MIVKTKKWRRAMESYRAKHELGKEKGFAIETDKRLGKPARHLLKRLQDHMVAQNNLLPKHADGTLNTATQEVLIPRKYEGYAVVRYGLTQVGQHEEPWGSNDGPVVHIYESSTGAYGKAWCASFFWYCWKKAGYKGTTSAGAWNTTDNFGIQIADLAHARVGDGVSLNLGEGHIGIYLSHDDINVKLLSGNTGDAVGINEYPISSIHSICRPVVNYTHI